MFCIEQIAAHGKEMKMHPNAIYSKPFSRVVTVTLLLCLPAALPAAETAAPKRVARHYVLPATAENVQWGWYDVNEKPKLAIHSGDTVSIETLSHSLGQIKPGVPMEEIVRLRKANPGGGPHSITGPIYVEEAEPGDTLEIHILKITPKADGFNFNVPGRDFPTVGQLA